MYSIPRLDIVASKMREEINQMINVHVNIRLNSAESWLSVFILIFFRCFDCKQKTVDCN